MVTKLTITLEKDIMELATLYASKNGRNLSNLVENYLKTLVQKENIENEFSPTIKRLLGSVKAPKDFDYKKELTGELNEKYFK